MILHCSNYDDRMRNDYYFDVSWQKVLLQGSIFRGKKVILQQNIFGSNLA